MKSFHVYILASARRVLYVGVTSNIAKRVWQHQQNLIPGFTTKHKVYRLVYAEECPDAVSAIAREKQIKNWRREKKINLIESLNPDWKELPVN
jgi:putative endonuclease